MPLGLRNVDASVAQIDRGGRNAAVLVVLVLGAVTACAIPSARVIGPEYPALWPAVVSVESFAELLTALIFYNRFMISNAPEFAFYSAAYVWTGVTKIGYVLSFPGVITLAGAFGNESVPAWYFTSWHVGFGVFLLGGVLLGQRFTVTRTSRNSVAAMSTIGAGVGAVAMMALLSILAPALPPLVVNGNDYSHLMTVLLPGAAVICILIVWAFVKHMRRTTMMSFLAVALIANGLDLLLTMYAGNRFSLGWYVARIDSLVASGIVLSVLVGSLMALTAQLTARSEALSQLAYHDALTGIANKRAFDAALLREWDRSSRERRPIALLMCDVDFFKGYNDSLGHLAGDRALREVADILELQAWRPGDIAARFGGEEFVMLLAETNEDGALKVAERVREAIALRKLPYPDSPSGIVTISIGVAAIVPDHATKPSALVQMADSALYQAKGSGRNRVARHAGDPLFAADFNR